jgi:hypothetical protein
MSKPKKVKPSQGKSATGLPPGLAANLDKIRLGLYGDDLPADPAEHEEIFGQASVSLQKVITEIGKLWAKPCLVAILDGYRLGELLKQVREDCQVNHAQRFGKGAFRNLCRFFGLRVSRINRLLRLVEVFSRADIEELDRMRTRDGAPLEYFHVELLAEIHDRQSRRELLERMLAESWPGYMVLAAVNQIKKQQRIPRNVDTLLRQQERSADHFLNRTTAVWKQPAHSLRTMVQELPHEQYTEDLAARVKAHADKLGRLAEEAQAFAMDADAVHQMMVAVLADRKRVEADTPDPEA